MTILSCTAVPPFSLHPDTRGVTAASTGSDHERQLTAVAAVPGRGGRQEPPAEARGERGGPRMGFMSPRVLDRGTRATARVTREGAYTGEGWPPSPQPAQPLHPH